MKKASSESDHETSQNEVSCPACGHSFDAGQVAASRDLPHGFSGGDMGGGTEF
jgi:C4-type Zn-finger protein